jgi:hypothetical protein
MASEIFYTDTYKFYMKTHLIRYTYKGDNVSYR